MVTEKQLKNLKPFKKGVSGNPKGKPKGAKGFAATLRKIMDIESLSEDILAGENRKMSNSEKMMIKLYDIATTDHKKNKDLKAMEMIMDRLEGKPVQKQEITGADGDALLVEEITKSMTPKQAAEIYMAEVKNPNISKKAVENKSKKKASKKKVKK